MTVVDIMIAELGMDRRVKPIYFPAECDTVHLTGSFWSRKSDCQLKTGKIFGPGVLDMKGGLIIALYVAKSVKLYTV